MKTLIYFNRPDCPDNMGISQLTDDLNLFLEERKDIILNPEINGNILNYQLNKTTVTEEGISVEQVNGYALLVSTPENFEN